jgi:ketosteroid isomerase-like protein
VICKTFPLMLCILFSITILVGCAKPEEVATQPPPPTYTQMPRTPTLEPSPTTIPAREPVSAVIVEGIASAFETITNHQVEAWNTYDFDAMRALYADDIEFTDTSFGDHMIGINKFIDMARAMSVNFPSMRRQVINHFVGLEDSVASYDYWGFYGFTPDDPMLWVSRLRTSGDRILNWTLLEGLTASEKLKLGNKIRFDEAESLLSSYQSAWSSGDPMRVAELYSNDAVRTDTLFQEKQEGQEALTSFAESFFAWYPEAQWTLLQSFGEWEGEAPLIGGTYAVKVTDSSDQPCEVLVAVLLQASEGKITHEDLYYEPDSLIKCGWVK